MSQEKKVTVEYLGSLKGHNGWVTCLAVSQSGNRPLLVSGSRDKSLIIWDLDLEGSVQQDVDSKEERFVGKPKKSLTGHNHFVSSLSISSDGKKVLSGSWDKTLRYWDLATYKSRSLVGHTKDVLCCYIHPNNRILYSGSMDRTVKIWNVEAKCQYTITDFNGWVSNITPIPGDKEIPMISVGSWDSKVRIFDKDFKLIKGIGSIDYPVVSMSVDNSGEFLFVAEKNGSIKIWGLGAENQADELKQHYDLGTDIFAINYEHEYTTVFSVGTSNGLTIKDISEGKDLFTFSYGNNVSCLSLAFDQSKKFLFAGFSDGLIRVYRFKTE